MEDDYISIEEAAKQLNVTKPSLYYYMRLFKVERKKFPLDKRVYIKREDFQKIRQLKDDAARRGGE